MYARSNEIMTLTMKVKVTKNAYISETGLDTHMITIIHFSHRVVKLDILLGYVSYKKLNSGSISAFLVI